MKEHSRCIHFHRYQYIFEPFPLSMKIGSMFTDLKARTGLFTPPGINFLLREKLVLIFHMTACLSPFLTVIFFYP